MKTQQRESGIEALKIFAMLLIVLSHVVQTLGKIIDLDTFQNLQFFVLAIFRQFGPLGNAIFFICSAWFLLDSNKVNKEKWFFMLLEIWVISVIILVAALILRQGKIDSNYVIKSLLPTISQNNWYLTCYLLFYPIHPFLNNLIEKFTPRVFLRVIFPLFFLYFGISFIFSGKLYCSDLIIWIALYFIVAYMRQHQFTVKHNVFLLALGIAGMIGLPLLCGLLGNFIPPLSSKITYWAKNNNPFLLIIALSLFNFAKKIHLKNALINSISKLSLLIYIIHENIILRRVFRLEYMKYTLETFGEKTILLQVLLLSAAIFLFALICAWLYCKLARKAVFKGIASLYCILKKYYLALESRLLR